ncbi:hypothetical protein [Mycolicibacterium fluoranthenivorans]|uniref:hypothetical protein n=1 Tax=Mycolicibacterium fluoranthenivorans TaxID=258505 RepID=UPI001113C07F|nr:hypothetical protein [Mycolicibacterium fluoranthenivorans]
MGDLNPATGQFTHVVHYAGHSFGVMTEHAQLLAKAIGAATLGTHAAVKMKVTEMESGETRQLTFLVGPGIPILVDGPVLPG